MARARARPSNPAEPHKLIEEGEAMLDAGNFAGAREIAREAAHAADRARDAPARSLARRLLALAMLYTDRSDEALAAGHDAARIAQGARAPREHALAELALSEVVRARGDYVGALRHASRARTLALRAKDTNVLRSVLADYALVLSRVGDGERARELFDEALALPSDGQPPMRAFRVLYNAAMTHRAAGRIGAALETLDAAERFARETGLHAAAWSTAAARTLALLDAGAVEEAQAILDAQRLSPDAPTWQRAQQIMLRASTAHAAGARPEEILSLAAEGLALGGVESLTRVTLERLRATALLARGEKAEAERIAIALISESAKGGGMALVAAAMALAARAASHPQSALLRWLGAHALASSGVAARVEHEALAALTGEPEPIGMLGRTGLAVVRARLVDRAPPRLRATTKRMLRQVELRFSTSVDAQRAEADIALDPAAIRAKEALGIVGTSPGLLRAIATVARASRNASSLVLLGETGSGKELFAKLAHELSPRAKGPFVAINCAAIPEPLLEAELFGHERGAFTGAERARKGLFVEAEGGTLFLDELGEMSAAMQAKLLRVLEDREVRALGGNKSRKVDVRVIAATHRDLVELIAGRQFREDLYYRVAALTVRIPPLRERPEDVPAIARALLERNPATRGFRLDVPGLTALAEYNWPGNVRELANVIQLAAALAEFRVVGGVEVRQAIGERTKRAPVSGPVRDTTLDGLRKRQRSELRELVGRALAGADGNKRAAARSLGISRQGLYRLLEEENE